MSFGAGMGAGFGSGFGSGIAVGISSGQKQATAKLREYADANEIKIFDREGHELEIDQFLAEATRAGCRSNSKGAKIVLALLLALGVAALCTLIFFVVR